MCPLSNAVRADVCWHGRQEMRAVMSEDVGGELEADAFEMRFSPDVGDRVRSTSFHQSSSTTFWMPHSLNHFFRPKPTTNCAFG